MYEPRNVGLLTNYLTAIIHVMSFTTAIIISGDTESAV